MLRSRPVCSLPCGGHQGVYGLGATSQKTLGILGFVFEEAPRPPPAAQPPAGTPVGTKGTPSQPAPAAAATATAGAAIATATATALATATASSLQPSARPCDSDGDHHFSSWARDDSHHMEQKALNGRRDQERSASVAVVLAPQSLVPPRSPKVGVCGPPAGYEQDGEIMSLQ